MSKLIEVEGIQLNEKMIGWLQDLQEDENDQNKELLNSIVNLTFFLVASKDHLSHAKEELDEYIYQLARIREIFMAIDKKEVPNGK